MAPLIFSNRIVNAISWGSDAPSGFREVDVELFRYLVPTFAPVLEVTAGRRIYGELLATYVGRDPFARIMAGEVPRGDGPPPQTDTARCAARGGCAHTHDPVHRACSGLLHVTSS